ncbi:hypothetical protein JVT61DRAFT_4347 [Boletus reticuloceps]|uniref:Protein kinase domain-containing protein n=1 Tax=Boletus reticuloceps TaxID=495285 RepID=A0A8I2YLG2_9AGAM|nr:hypothetical protein JVT61DRAFT_4347 [Boletus reticuloceps]
MHMVIMDRIDGSDALDQFDGEYLPESLVKQVEAALAVLHSKNLVHGAIRRYNVLVKMEPNVNSEASDMAVGEKQWHVYLIGFEWVGEANKDRYNIKSSMGRHEYRSTGAIPGGIMELVHDKRMYLHFAGSWY